MKGNSGLALSFIGNDKKWAQLIKFFQERQCNVSLLTEPSPLLNESQDTRPALIVYDCDRFSDKKMREIESLLSHPLRYYVVALIPQAQASIIPQLIKRGVPDVITEPLDTDHLEFILAKSIISKELEDPNFVYLFPTDGSRISKRKLAKDSLEKIISRFSLEEVVAMRIRALLEKKDLNKLESLYSMIIGEIEKALFKALLEKTEGNIIKAAKILGINRNTLSKKLKQYKIRK